MYYINIRIENSFKTINEEEVFKLLYLVNGNENGNS